MIQLKATGSGSKDDDNFNPVGKQKSDGSDDRTKNNHNQSLRNKRIQIKVQIL